MPFVADAAYGVLFKVGAVLHHEGVVVLWWNYIGRVVIVVVKVPNEEITGFGKDVLSSFFGLRCVGRFGGLRPYREGDCQ